MSAWAGRLRRYGRIGASMLASFLLQARNLVISVVVFRVIEDPRHVWGVVNQVNAAVTLLALPAKLGLEFAAVQLVAKYRTDAPRAALHAFVGATVVRTALALIFGLPLVLAPEVVGPWIGLGGQPELVQMGGWLLVSTSLYEFGAYLVSATDAFGAMMLSRLLYAIANVALIAWVAADPSTDPARDVVGAQVWAGAAAMLYLVWALWGQARDLAARLHEPQAADAPVGGAMVLHLVRFSIPLTAVAAAGQVFSYLDRVMLPVLASPEALGSYAVASSVIAAALFGTYAFRNVARTRLPGQLRVDPASARGTLRANYRASQLVAAWICAGLVAVAPDLLVAIYGPEAAEAAAMLPWFVPYVVLTAHATFSATALVAADRPKLYAWLTAGAALLNVALNLALMPLYGGYGAIAAATLASVPLAAVSGWEVARAYQHAPFAVPALRASAAASLRALVFAVVAGGAGALITGPSLLASVAAGLAVTGLFGAQLAISGELRTLRQAL